MDTDRYGDQGRCPRARAGGPAQQHGSVSERFRLPVLFAAALMVIGAPQALALCVCDAYTAVNMATIPEEPMLDPDYPLETIEEPSEPLIVDDLRTEGVTVAAGRTSPIYQKARQ